MAITLGLLLSLVPGAAVLGASEPAPRDQVQILRMSAGPAAAAAPGEASAIQFQLTVNYKLQSADRGMLLVFFFEDDQESASQQTENARQVTRGRVEVPLEAFYTPRSSVEAVTVMAALFDSNQTLLAWGATNAVSLAPWPARNAFAGAMAARLAGDDVRAIEELSRAVSLEPNAGQYYYWRADSFLRLGQHDAALADFKRALALLPNDRTSRVGLATALLWKQDWEGAIAEATRAIEASTRQDRPLAWAHRARGIAWAALGHAAEAIADYRSYLELSPNVADRAQVEGWIAELG
ncbi:MAG: tetratricopeptide repeat protein [Chloroflexi bacterium]|nr:tetratricopeptide repeat protein [Chloroflexota bacterium]